MTPHSEPTQNASTTALRTLARAAAQLIPLGIGSALEVFISGLAESERERRLEVLFDEMERSGRVDEATLRRVPFLRRFLVTARAAAHTQREAKIRLFARLLVAELPIPEGDTDADAFEEMLRVLDDLSVRELRVLGCLERFERAHPRPPGVDPITHIDSYWATFAGEAAPIMGVAPRDIDIVLQRIARSGLYRPVPLGMGEGRSTMLSDAGTVGTLTVLYYSLRERIGTLGDGEETR